MDRELCLVWLYCVVAAAVRSIVGSGRARSRGPEPVFTDEEVLTLQLRGEMAGLPSDAALWRQAVDHWRMWFPHIGSEWNFTRRCANLRGLMDKVLTLLFGPTADWNACDGLPLPVCLLVRALRDKRFRGEAAWGFCAAKDEHYYGFKAGVSMNSRGEIYRLWLGPANVDERDMVESTAFGMGGLLFADKGLISPALKDLPQGRGIDLTTPLRKNMSDTRPKWLVQQAMRLRRGIETVFSRLTDHFGIGRTKGRDFRRRSSRILRTVLAYDRMVRFESIAALA